MVLMLLDQKALRGGSDSAYDNKATGDAWSSTCWLLGGSMFWAAVSAHLLGTVTTVGTT